MTLRSLFLVVFVAALSTGCAAKKTEPAASGSDSGNKAAAREISETDLNTLRQNFRRVHFAFDSAQLDEGSRQLLAANGAILKAHSNVQIEIEGHTDSFGSDEYNLALGDRRARTVETYLADLGVGKSQVRVISYGKEKALVPPGSKDAEAVNRRAEFRVVLGSDVAGSSDAAGLAVSVSVGE